MSEADKNKKDSKVGSLFNGRLRLQDTDEDRKIFNLVKTHMALNNISTFTAAIKDMIVKKSDGAEVVNHVHYWIPVTEEDIPKKIFEQKKDK